MKPPAVRSGIGIISVHSEKQEDYHCMLLILMPRIATACTSVKIFVIMTGHDIMSHPYIVQRTNPIERITNIPRDMSSTDLVRTALSNCGKKADVVKAPAMSPINVL